jgi:hypothetical protein
MFCKLKKNSGRILHDDIAWSSSTYDGMGYELKDDGSKESD